MAADRAGPVVTIEYLATWILTHGAAEKILREHRPDASGRCPKCRGGGDSSGRVQAPCLLRRAAEMAITR